VTAQPGRQNGPASSRYDVPNVTLPRSHLAAFAVPLALALVVAGAQTPSDRAPPQYTVVSSAGRKGLAVARVGDREAFALDDLAAAFRLAVREDALAGGVSVSYKGRTITLTPGQNVASVEGRLVSLPAPVSRDGKRWLVPVEFVSRALALMYDATIDLRSLSRLIVVGDLRVPRVVVSMGTAGSGTRLTLDITPRAAHAIVQEPGRLLIRFESDALDVSLPAAQPQSLVQAVRVVDPANLLAADLGPRSGPYRESVQPAEGGGERLVIDVMPGAAEQTALSQVAPSVPPSPAGAAAAQPPAPIVIDAGHGGEDTGVRAPSGTLEKDVTLAVARKLKAAIEGRLGVRALLTRDRDIAVPLDDRTAAANNSQADLFVSLHANGSLNPDLRGAVVFYLSADATELPQPPGAGEAMPAFGAGARSSDVVSWELAQIRFVGQSAALAEATSRELGSRVTVGPRPVQRAPLRLLVGANMPAVLVEMGFLSSAVDEQSLLSEGYQALLVQGIAEAIASVRAGDVKQDLATGTFSGMSGAGARRAP
jgi:N-acetylmuramoyl-L-alanine amidase